MKYTTQMCNQSTYLTNVFYICQPNSALNSKSKERENNAHLAITYSIHTLVSKLKMIQMEKQCFRFSSAFSTLSQEEMTYI